MLTRSVGRFEVVALRDAFGPFDSWVTLFPDATSADWERARRLDPDAFGADGVWRLAFRCFVIRPPGGETILVDTGVGHAGSPAASWAPVPGRLPAELVAAGVDVEEVDTVVLTHLHADHGGWAVAPDGVPMFPNARYVVQHDEVAVLESGTAPMLAYAVRPLQAAGQLDEVDGEARLVAERRGGTVTVVPTPGHTIGHQSVLVEDGRDRLVVTGDVLVHAVQLVEPEVAYAYEQDPVVARRTRVRLLERARADRAWLATMHLSEPFIRAH
ncbi:MAG: MBL fold metallo-hydrolase [Nocardioidaceae bacterium]